MSRDALFGLLQATRYTREQQERAARARAQLQRAREALAFALIELVGVIEGRRRVACFDLAAKLGTTESRVRFLVRELKKSGVRLKLL